MVIVLLKECQYFFSAVVYDKAGHSKSLGSVSFTINDDTPTLNISPASVTVKQYQDVVSTFSVNDPSGQGGHIYLYGYKEYNASAGQVIGEQTYYPTTKISVGVQGSYTGNGGDFAFNGYGDIANRKVILYYIVESNSGKTSEVKSLTITTQKNVNVSVSYTGNSQINGSPAHLTFHASTSCNTHYEKCSNLALTKATVNVYKGGTKVFTKDVNLAGQSSDFSVDYTPTDNDATYQVEAIVYTNAKEVVGTQKVYIKGSTTANVRIVKSQAPQVQIIVPDRDAYLITTDKMELTVHVKLLAPRGFKVGYILIKDLTNDTKLYEHTYTSELNGLTEYDFQKEFTFISGRQYIVAGYVKDKDNKNTGTVYKTFYVGNDTPKVTITAPSSGSELKLGDNIVIHVCDAGKNVNKITLNYNGAEGQASYSESVNMNNEVCKDFSFKAGKDSFGNTIAGWNSLEGAGTLKATAEDSNGNSGEESINVRYSCPAPTIVDKTVCKDRGETCPADEYDSLTGCLKTKYNCTYKCCDAPQTITKDLCYGEECPADEDTDNDGCIDKHYECSYQCCTTPKRYCGDPDANNYSTCIPGTDEHGCEIQCVEDNSLCEYDNTCPTPQDKPYCDDPNANNYTSECHDDVDSNGCVTRKCKPYRSVCIYKDCPSITCGDDTASRDPICCAETGHCSTYWTCINAGSWGYSCCCVIAVIHDGEYVCAGNEDGGSGINSTSPVIQGGSLLTSR